MTNQNCLCPFCGASNIKNMRLTNGFAAIQHPNCDCPLRSNIFGKEEWNSRPPNPLEKKVVSYLANRVNYYQITETANNSLGSPPVFPIDPHNHIKKIEAKSIYNAVLKIFGVKE